MTLLIRFVFLAVIGVVAVPGILQAEPSWARKYNAACTLCHTTYPRLNRTGYEFKRLGYRLPRELEGNSAPVQRDRISMQASHEPTLIKPSGYRPRPATSDSESGRVIYQKLNCAGCHAAGQQGGRIGPPLDGVGGRRDPDFLRAHITDPEEHAKRFPEQHANRPALMPHPHASPQDVELLVAYLLTLPEPPAGFLIGGHAHTGVLDAAEIASEYLPALETASSRAGQQLYYDQGCASCHAIGQTGGQFGPSLNGVGARRSRQYIVAHITSAQLHAEQFPGEHSGGAMMPETNVSSAEMQQIADFLLTLPAESGGGRPANRLEDYFAVSYIPAVEIERESGETHSEYERRELMVFAAGPLGRNFSFFVQPLPLSQEEGLGGKFEMAQGVFNYGRSRQFLQVRFGQLFSLRNAGFAGTDRGLTESRPLMFQPLNGFALGSLGRGASVEYTFPGWMTVKAFGTYDEAVETEEEGEGEGEGEGEEDEELDPDEHDEAALEFRRSRSYGFVVEKVIGTKGLDGVQFQFVAGHTPLVVGGVPQNALRFQRYSVFANKSLVDGDNFERINTIVGVSLLRDDRFLGLDPDQRSRGYGYFVELDAVPVVNHLSCFARFDTLRPTTRLSRNTARAGTAGVIYDVLKFARVLFEYQRLGGTTPVNGFRIGGQLNF